MYTSSFKDLFMEFIIWEQKGKIKLHRVHAMLTIQNIAGTSLGSNINNKRVFAKLYRLPGMYGIDKRCVWFNLFHSFCERVLVKYIAKGGLETQIWHLAIKLP